MTINQKTLSKENTLSIRGLVAILVLFSHLHFPYPVSNIGYLCVAIFFFFSGYGLKFSLARKENYLDGFLLKRFPTIIIPYWTMCLFYIGMIAILGYYFSGKTLLWSFINPFLDTYRYISVAWYVCMLVLLYGLFYLAYKFFKEQIAFWIITGSIILYCIILYYTNLKPDYWSMSISTFIFGIGIASIKKETVQLSILMYLSLMIVSVVLFGISFTRPHLFGAFGVHISVLSIVFLIILLLPMNILKRSRIFNFYGKISYEFFLVHPLFIQFVNNNEIFIGPKKDRICCYWPYIHSLHIENRYLQVLLILLFATCIAYLLHLINTRILSLYHKILLQKIHK